MALCSNCGKEAGTDNFCGECGHTTSQPSVRAPGVNEQLPPPNDEPKLPPPRAHGYPPLNPRRNSRQLETAGKVAGGCGVVALIMLAVFIYFLIQFMNAISTPSDGMGTRTTSTCSQECLTAQR